MARPKKNTKAGKLASEKWRKTMQEKYGNVSEKMAQTGRIGGQNGKGPNYKGGFAGDHDLAVKAGAKGGKKSRRLPAQRDENGRPIRKDGTPYATWPTKADKEKAQRARISKKVRELHEEYNEEKALEFEEIYKELNARKKKGFFARLFRR